MMTLDKKLIPTLRFPQFSGEWEVKRLGDVVNYLKGFAFKSDEYRDQGIRIIRVSDLGKSSILNTIDSKFIDENKFELFSRYTILDNDIIITSVGSKPDLLDSAVGRAVFINVKSKMLLNQNLIILRTKENVLSYFVFCNFVNTKYNYFIRGIHRGNANQSNITVLDLLAYKINLPSLPEQEKIASFLSSIDRKVELLKAKKEQLEQYKKGMMQQLFAQTIRFKDQNGNQFPEWQEKRLGEIMYKDKLVKCDKININEILTVRLHQKGVVVSSNGKNLSIGATTYYHRYKGQFIYGKQNIFNGAFGFVPSEFDNYLSSADIPALSVKVKLLNVNFFVYMMANNGNYRRIENLAIGTGSKRVHEQDLLKLKINLPSLPEQQKIADFLSAIDRKIEGVGQQMAQTELFKKAMLQQLFV